MDLTSALLGLIAGVAGTLVGTVSAHHSATVRDRSTYRRRRAEALALDCQRAYTEALAVVYRLIINTGIHTVEDEEFRIRSVQMTLALLSTQEIADEYRSALESVGAVYEGIRDQPHHISVLRMDEMERRDLLRNRSMLAHERGLMEPAFRQHAVLAKRMRAHLDELRVYAWSK